MLSKYTLKNILFVDVETVPQVSSFDDLSENLKPLWLKKASRLTGDASANLESMFYEKAGIYSEFGKIVCISAGVFVGDDEAPGFRVKAFYSDNETELLESFAKMLNRKYAEPGHYLCGHNCREFDIPYIARRMLINRIPLPSIINISGHKPWDVPFIDTMELWKFGDHKNYTSLALLAAVFNIPTPKDDIDGSDVARVYWVENDLKRIAVYCNKDVVTTARLFLKFSFKGELPEDRIEVVV